jgi:hypothetical protein
MSVEEFDATTCPTSYSGVSDFAAEIYSNLVRKYKQNENQFIDVTSEKTGLIYRCIGSVSMLLLVNAFENVGTDGQWKDIVLTEFRKAKQYVDENGFDSTPLGTAILTKNYFTPKASAGQNYYMDSVSWVLSFALQMRFAQREKRIILETNDGRAVREVIQQTVGILVSSSTEQGGWGFCKGCTQPDLYFSFCVSEALADFGDYVMGEAEELGIDKDTDVIDTLPPGLIDSVLDARLKTLDWLKKTYLPFLGKREIEVYPGSGGSPHLHLYGTFYVIEMLILNNIAPSEDTARYKQENDSDRAQRAQDSKLIERAVEHAIYLSRIDFDRAYEDRDWWDSPDKSSLTINWGNHPNINVSTPKLQEPGFVPLSLRCNTLYAYYISHGLDERLKQLFQLVFQDRNREYDLWDGQNDNLMVTERSIEALVDYADYLKRFAPSLLAPSSGVMQPSASVVADVEQAIRRIVRDEMTSALAASKPEASSTDATKAKIDDIELLDVLTSALAKSRSLLQNPKLDSTKLGVSPEKLDRKVSSFCDEFSSLVAVLLSSELRANTDSTLGKKAVGSEAIKRQYHSLMFAIANWIGKNPDGKLGDLFLWVNQGRANEEIGTIPKSTNEGGRR